MAIAFASDSLDFFRDVYFDDENRRLVEACRRGDRDYVHAHLMRQDSAHPELWADETLDSRWGMQAIAHYLHGVPPLDVLDVACGSCQLLYELERQGHRVAGVDASAVRVELHRPRLPHLQLGFAESIPFAAESFDVVIALECLEHVMSLDAALREVLRVLRPNGLLLAQVPNGTFADGVNHVRLFDARRLTTVCDRLGLRAEHVLHIPYLVGEPPNNLFLMASKPAASPETASPSARALAEVRRRGATLAASIGGQPRPHASLGAM